MNKRLWDVALGVISPDLQFKPERSFTDLDKVKDLFLELGISFYVEGDVLRLAEGNRGLEIDPRAVMKAVMKAVMEKPDRKELMNIQPTELLCRGSDLEDALEIIDKAYRWPKVSDKTSELSRLAVQ